MSDVDLKFCRKHLSTRPCQKCLLAQCGGNQAELAAKTLDDLLGIGAAVLAEWRPMAAAAGIRPDQKCDHGVYLAQHYCNVCAWLIIEPGYNPEVYRTEINKALKSARMVLNSSPEGKKDSADLAQIVDIEIWKATKKYDSEMNAKLAYTIARNQSDKFLTKLIEEKTVAVLDADGAPVLDEFGQPKRVPRFASLDDKTPEGEGEHDSASSVDSSAAERAITRRGLEGRPAMEQFLLPSNPANDNGLPAEIQEYVDGGGLDDLRRLVGTWWGEKRRVGEAMLAPGFTVRNVPGVSKSSAGRIRQLVMTEFKAFIVKALSKSGTNLK
jgi:hypothetical protein